MPIKLIELEYPYEGRRKATIVTNNKNVCEYLAQYPDAKISASIIKTLSVSIIKMKTEKEIAELTHSQLEKELAKAYDYFKAIEKELILNKKAIACGDKEYK